MTQLIKTTYMNKLMNVPNKIKQPPQCCNYCGKIYKTRANLDKHINLCELINKGKKTILLEEDDETPSHKNIYKMLLELGQKYNRLEEKIEEVSKWVVKKKKKINVLEWLNANNTPEFLFEILFEKVVITEDDINILLNNPFNVLLDEIFARNIYSFLENEFPIFAFVQKANIFYIYDKINDEKKEWHELTREKLIKFLNKVHMKIIKYFNDWKKTKEHEIRSNDSFATLCDKTIVKLMSVELKQDATLSKIRSMMYNKMKTDMKALIEYEFEF